MQHKITSYLLPILTFTLPLIFFPMFINAFETPKAIAILVTIFLVIIAKLITLLASHKLSLPEVKSFFPTLVIIILTLTTLILNPEGRPEALVGKGLLLLALPILSFLILSSKISHSQIKLTVLASLLSTTVLAVFSIAQLTFLYSNTTLPAYMQTRLFTPTGSTQITLILLAVGLVISLSHALLLSKQKYLMLLIGAIHFVALAAYLSLMLRTDTFNNLSLPFLASWSIMLDTAKAGKALFVGVGLSNFPALFTTVKPTYLNATSFWNMIPGSSGSELLQLISTGGILLAGAFLGFFVSGLTKHTEGHDFTPLRLGFLTLILGFFLFPSSIVTYTLLFIFGSLLLSQDNNPHELSVSLAQVRWSLTLIALVSIVATSYFLGKAYLADFYLSKSSVALQQNDGKAVYEATLTAVKYMPNIASYRVAYSQVNLQLAGSISQSDKTPSDETKNQISTLLNQAIREGKAATSLRPNLSSTWQNLASIYTSLLGIADGADQQALDNMRQAIFLDRSNPVLRVELGNLLVRLGDQKAKADKKDESKTLYTQAIQEYNTAATLKNNYASAYYNLSKAAEKLGNYELAVQALNSTLPILDANGNDYQTAKTELENLKAKLPTPTSSPTATSSATPTE